MSTETNLPIFVRAYTERPNSKPVSGKRRSKLDKPSRWTLIFDCETTVDPGQALRVGFYQLREGENLFEAGVFYDAEVCSAEDVQTIIAYAVRLRLKVHTVRSFADHVFLKFGYWRRAAIVGFNLPFDLSRIAISYGPARGHMHGGFTFKLSNNPFAPHLRIKYLSRRAALIDFTIGEEQNTPRGMRKRGLKSDWHRGCFVDVKTLAAALTSKGFSLASLCDFLKLSTRKRETDEHGGPITDDYLDYARNDVEATWQCFRELTQRYHAYRLDRAVHRILSEASIGKACLQQMAARPLLECQPDFPRDMFGRIMCAYYGGRAEVRIRREVREVRCCDFKSMYPTVNTLMGLWRFVVADGMSWRDSTKETRDFLQRVTLDDLQSKAIWTKLRTLVRLRPDADLLPVRAKYDAKSNTIGLNFLTCPQSLWYTLADVVAAKLLSGKTPSIEEAITFEPGPLQEGLKSIELLGRYPVDPERNDVFRRLVNLRDQASGEEKKAIKIIANATSYGIFIEITRDDAAKPEPIDLFGPDGIARPLSKTTIEQPGGHFNPLLGALITGAARLMLALAEKLVEQESLDWVFCDTDSLAIARPVDMTTPEFLVRVDRVVQWFDPLNPYEKSDPILKIEELNFDRASGEPRALYAFAISAKRYALFNLNDDGTPVLRKASQHGLGHLMSPDKAASRNDAEVGIAAWQAELWRKIVRAALNGKPDQVAVLYGSEFDRPALSRYGATTPDQLAWFRRWNEGRPYPEQVKPFNFLISFGVKSFLQPLPEIQIEEIRERGRPKKRSILPVAPYDSVAEVAAAKAFCRNSGEPVLAADLKTYRETLQRYHISCEFKFEGGEYLNRGRTRRRHVIAVAVHLIGKEANKLDDEAIGIEIANYGSISATLVSPKESDC